MGAIYRRELKSCFTNMTGAVAVAVMLLAAGLMFRYYNLYNGALTYHFAVSNSTIMFYVVVPVLSMGVLSLERRQKTDQLLFTAPLSCAQIVIGKYLALVTVFALPVLVMCVQPLVMTRFGAETLKWDYACILMFFLMGCAYLAVGMFISGMTESPVIAAIGCIVFVFATQMLGSIFPIIGASGISSLVFLIVLAALFGLLCHVMTRSYFFSMLSFGILAILLLLCFKVKPEWFSGRTESVLRVLDFYTHYQDIAAGVFSWANFLYFLFFAAGGVVLCIAYMERGRAQGGLHLALSAAVIACMFALMAVISELPSDLVTADLTEQQLFTPGNISRELISSLENEVSLFFVTENGEEDEGVEKLLDAFENAGEKLHVERVDAVVSPTFTKKYTDEEVSLNSVIAVSGDRVSVADYRNFYQYNFTGTEYQISAYDAEGQITAAIAEVMQDENKKICYTVGHDELELGAELEEAAGKAGAVLSEVNLLSGDIPEDADALVIFSPRQDLTKEERDKVLHYLYEGGSALLVSMAGLASGAETPNYDTILAAYGISRAEGIVMEGSDACYVQAPYLILPEVSSASSVTSGLENSNIICALPEALSVEDKEDAAWTVTPLLFTSDQAYLKTDIDSTVEKTAEDESGEYVLAAAVEQTFSNDSFGKSDIPGDEEEDEERTPKVTKMLVFTTPCILSSGALSSLIQQNTALPEGNTELISRVLQYLTGEERAVYVPAKVLETPQTTIDTGTVNALGSLFMIILPALVLAAGFGVWAVRRRR